MPVFISYSHTDKQFVDQLALQLVVQKVHVWLDRWELHVGDSLITKIQDAITGASALLVILSKTSVASVWCTKELNSGLIRELEEKRVVVLPVLIEDCGIPLFLREKMYADFRTNFDEGLETILESIAKVTSEWQGRIEDPLYHTDWSIDWGDLLGNAAFRITMIDTLKDQPYTVLGMITVVGDDNATEWIIEQERLGMADQARREVFWALEAKVKDKLEYDFRLTDQMEQGVRIMFELRDMMFVASMSVRRLGVDTGRDIYFRFGGQVRNVAESMRQVARQESEKHSQTTTTSTKAETKSPKAANRVKKENKR